MLAAVFTLGAGFKLSSPWLSKLKKERLFYNHVKRSPATTPLDKLVLETLAAFSANLFGTQLIDASRNELKERLQYATKIDGGWFEEFQWFAMYINKRSNQMFNNDFPNLDEQQQSALFTLLRDERDVGTQRSKLLAMVSDDERNRRRVYTSTIPRLRRIYTHSGIPWRRRGYQTWPGIAGDQTAYRQKGPEYSC